MIKVEMKYSKANLQKAFSIHYQKSFPVRGKVLLWLGILLIWTGIMLSIVNNDKAHIAINISYIIAGFVFIGVHYFLMRNIGNFTYKRIKNPDQSFSFYLTQDIIKMIAGKKEYTIAWEDIYKSIIEKDIILLYVSKTQFYFFPKENFIPEKEFDDCVEIVKEKTSTKK